METDGLVIVGNKDTYQGSDNSVLCSVHSLDLSFGFRHNMH